MTRDSSIPGYAELDDWPREPAPPLHIKDFGRYRDGGPRGGSFFVDLEDSYGTLFSFFFDRFLGRLCYGSELNDGDDAAFLKRGSRIEAEAFSLIESSANQLRDGDEVLACLRHARTWAKLA